MSYHLKAGLLLFLKNAILCLILAMSLGILVSALSTATHAFLRTYQNQKRFGDYQLKDVVRFRTAVTGLKLKDEAAFQRSFFPLFEKDAVTARQYSTLLTESGTEYLITGDESFLPRQMRGTEDIRIYYNATSPPHYNTVQFLGHTIPLQPVNEKTLFFLSSYVSSSDEERPLYIYVRPALFTDPQYTMGLLGSGNITMYEEFITNARALRTNGSLVEAFINATNNEFYNTVNYFPDTSETSFMTGFIAPYLSVSSLAAILVLVLIGALLLNQLQHSFAIHMLNGATSREILLQFMVVLSLIGFISFMTAAFLLRWRLDRLFWYYLTALFLYELFLVLVLFRKLQPDRILQTIRNR